MTTKPINLRDYQVKAALDGRLRLIVVPVVPQPDAPGRIAWDVEPNGEWYGAPLSVVETVGPYRCPLGAPGAVLWGREAWMPAHCVSSTDKRREGKRSAAYKQRDGHLDVSWRSAAVMPRWASRITLTVESVEVRRVSEFDSRRDLMRTGAEGLTEFCDDWDRRYGPKGLTWFWSPWAWFVGVKS